MCISRFSSAGCRVLLGFFVCLFNAILQFWSFLVVSLCSNNRLSSSNNILKYKPALFRLFQAALSMVLNEITNYFILLKTDTWANVSII